jgi:RHS repeat-associated protein
VKFGPATLVINYAYQYKDHLGNIRLNFGKDPETNVLRVLEENHYYPFGLKHQNYNTGRRQLGKKEEILAGNLTLMPALVLPTEDKPMVYKYKYNGKEWQDELGLNMYTMDMRQYDPAIARWVVQDPVVHFDYSPYSAFDNNPVFWADPSGADATKGGSGQDEYSRRMEAKANSPFNYISSGGHTDPKKNKKAADTTGLPSLPPGGIKPINPQLTALTPMEPAGLVNIGGNIMQNEQIDPSELLGLASTAAEVGKQLQYSDYFKTWTGKNGKIYQGLSGRGPNGVTGSRGFAKTKAGIFGIGGAFLGGLSIASTEYEYANSLSQNYGPNMRSHLANRRVWDQAGNGSGFLGIFGAAASFGYNLGHLIEGACNCNIQYNPYTKDFTPIEETLMMYDRLGIYLNKN